MAAPIKRDKWEAMKACLEWTADPKDMLNWHKICDEGRREEEEWIKKLRIMGFKAAHPNDYWVTTEYDMITCSYRGKIRLVHPQFNDGVGVGDKMVIGSPTDKRGQSKSIRMTGIIGDSEYNEYTFEYL